MSNLNIYVEAQCARPVTWATCIDGNALDLTSSQAKHQVHDHAMVRIDQLQTVSRPAGVHSTVACAARKQRKKGKSKGRQKDQAPEAAANGASRSSVADTTATASAASDSQDGKAPSNGASAMPATAAGTAGSHTDASVSADPAAAANAASSTNGAATDTASAKGAAESSTRATTADGSTGAASSTDATSTSAAAVGESNATTTASPTDSSSGASASSNGGGGGFVPLRRPEEAQRRYEERSRSQKAASTSAASVQDASASAQDMQPPVTMAREKRKSQSTITAISRDKGGGGSLLPQQLLQKVGLLVAFVAASRVGVYARLPGIDIEQYSEAVARSSILGWVDNVTGGSLSNVGVFTLGIIPAINASIFLQLLTISFPSLKKLQREEGPSGRARYQLYQKLATLAFAAAQSFGQLTTLKCATSACAHALSSPYCHAAYSTRLHAMWRRGMRSVAAHSPWAASNEHQVHGLRQMFARMQFNACRNYASDPSPQWFLSNSFALVAGAMIVNQLADYITELKLGNGTSVLIFASIASFLPTSIGSAFQQAGQSGSSGVAIYFISFLLTTFGVVVAQVRHPVHLLPVCGLVREVCGDLCAAAPGHGRCVGCFAASASGQ